MHHKNSVVDDGAQRKPTIDALDELEETLGVVLTRRRKSVVNFWTVKYFGLKIPWNSLCTSGAPLG